MDTSSEAVDRKGATSPTRFYGIISIALVVATLLILWVGDFPLTAFSRYIIAVSFVAFILTGFDKRIAGTAAMRVPEKVLFAVALLGGTPGLLLGMRLFRHKTRKSSFQLILLMILLLQLAMAKALSVNFQELFLVAPEVTSRQ